LRFGFLLTRRSWRWRSRLRVTPKRHHAPPFSSTPLLAWFGSDTVRFGGCWLLVGWFFSEKRHAASRQHR